MDKGTAQCVESSDGGPNFPAALQRCVYKERRTQAHLVGVLASSIDQKRLKCYGQVQGTIAMGKTPHGLIQATQGKA